jgi:8-oxo-dGTP diphosphatase
MENMERNEPKVGVGVMIIKHGTVLLARRRGAHGAGEYAFPGGHLEYMESFEQCARRETLEECGIELENVRFQFVANVHTYTPKHYVHIGLLADWKSGAPEVLEPEASGPWDWYHVDNLPQPLFAMCRLAVESYRTGKNYFDALSLIPPAQRSGQS